MKHLFGISFALILFSSGVQAQSFGFFSQDKLVESLDEVVFVVRQEYSVRGPDSLLYGNNNMDYYGEAYGPGVMIDGQLLTSRFTYMPYLRDLSFKSLGQNYVPEPTRTMIAGTSDSTFSLIKKEGVVVKNRIVALEGLKKPSITHQDTIAVETEGTVPAVILYFTSEDSVLTAESRFYHDFMDNKINWRYDGVGTLDNEDLGEQTKFGLIFYEKPGYGEASLIFGGFIEPSGPGKWRAFRIDEGDYRSKESIF